MGDAEDPSVAGSQASASDLVSIVKSHDMSTWSAIDIYLRSSMHGSNIVVEPTILDVEVTEEAISGNTSRL